MTISDEQLLGDFSDIEGDVGSR
ncbi:hypothetical protein O9992_27970 [Vibrio lentus]|nr:hypothetical protein [Vibrio lentus]